MRWTILAWTGAAAVSLLALDYITNPYVWIFAACAVALFVTAAMDKPRRAWWFNVACISVGLGIAEYYLWTSGYDGFAARRVQGGNYDEHVAPDGQLGWALQPESLVRQKLSFEGELVYDATYTIGPNGLRISSPSTSDPAASPQCILFFGGSFMFGQGLADDQTVPFRVHEAAPRRYRTYNFGVNGYGAHQMLSALQHGLVEDVVQCERDDVTHVFYQAITDHVRRAAGRRWFEQRGPRYVLAEDGRVELDGRFENNDDYYEDKTLLDLAGNQIYKSSIYQSIIQGQFVHTFSRDDINRYLAIVDEARREVRAAFPSSAFHVLLWDQDTLDNRTIRNGLRQRGIDVHLMSEILPNYEPDDLNGVYRIHERDPHPNALANELIAQYVVSQVLPQPGSQAAN